MEEKEENNIVKAQKEAKLDIKNGKKDQNKLSILYKNLIQIKTERDQIAYILEKKFIFIKERLQKDNSILFRCKQYRDKVRCQAFLIIFDNEVIKVNPVHCHEPNIKDVNRYLTKDIIKNNINSAENFII